MASSHSVGRDAVHALHASVAERIGVPPSLADLPPLRYYAEYARRYNEHDLGAFMELFAEGWIMVDHRACGWEDVLGREACRAMTKAVFAVSPDVRFAIDEVLACNDRVVAIRASYDGHGLNGRGAFAFLGGFVTVVEDGHSVSVDQYEYDDEAAMLARYRVLAGHS
jgi:predicted ester cyclase